MLRLPTEMRLINYYYYFKDDQMMIIGDYDYDQYNDQDDDTFRLVRRRV